MTVERLFQALGGGGSTLLAFPEGQVACKDAGPEHWVDTPTCAHLWDTERDGNVVLEAVGDGRFVWVEGVARVAN